MNLTNKTIIRTQFVTSDNNIYESREEAIEHEYELIRERLYNSPIDLYEYMIYLITSPDELDALMNDPYGERYFNLPEELEYPFYLCESSDGDGYYYHYNTLDYIIRLEETKLEALKNITIKEV